MRLDAAIAAATERLRDASESPRLDAEILLCRTINMPRSYLFAHPEDELDELTLARFEDVLERRQTGHRQTVAGDEDLLPSLHPIQES